MKLIDRLKAQTTKFFKILRNVGLGLAAAGGVIIASTIAIPTLIVTIGGYLIVGIAIGEAIITPPAAANPKPTFLKILKNFGVGAFNLSMSFMIILFLK